MSAAVAGAVLLLNSAASAAINLPPPVLDAAVRTELRALRTTAGRAAKGDAEAAWFRVAVFALEHASSIVFPGATDDPEI
ncbi:MAG: hypothetical protein ABIP29_02780, partial [Candidatus Eisenbacteria bacterium]